MCSTVSSGLGISIRSTVLVLMALWNSPKRQCNRRQPLFFSSVEHLLLLQHHRSQLSTDN